MKDIKPVGISFLILILLSICSHSIAKGFPDNYVQPACHFLNPSQVKMRNVLGQALTISENGRLLSLPGWNNGALIKMFSEEARQKNNTMDWYGEHAGKWLYTTTLAVNRTGNEKLKALLFKTADYLISNQEADGYLGSYSKQLRITNTGINHQKSWDVWSLSYMMLGFLKVNEYYPNEKYLNAAKNIGELFLKNFGDGTHDLTYYGTRYGISATIALEPVVELYKTTNDKRYLDFAKLIVKEMEQREGLRLITSSLNNKDMETIADGKAYQIIWNLLGVAKFYEITKNPDYLKAVQNAWQNILDYHLTIAGGPWGGVGKHKECFNAKGFWNPYGFVETCSIMSWIQLNKELLYITGEAKYAAEIEKSTYNALLGAQFPNGQDWSYHTFTNGRRHVANYNDCCPSSGAFALEELSPLAYTKMLDGISVNLYGQNQATIQVNNTNVTITQETNYPFDGKIRLTFTTSRKIKFPLFLRIPDWVVKTKILVNGKEVMDTAIRSGSYYTINRSWDKGDVVALDFPMQLSLVQKAEFATVPQGKADIYRIGWMALVRGPLVYAVDGLIDGEDREKILRLPAANATSLFKPVNLSKAVWPSYQLTLDGTKPLQFVPYYIADNRQVGDWRLTWIQTKID